MLRSQLGNLGNLAVTIAFIAALLSMIFYFFAAKENSKNADFWKKWARNAFYLHTAAIFSVVLVLFSIIFNKYFEYHYAWDNASLSLPLGYAISCFWQDQEGSFILWMFWNVILGLLMIYWFNTKKKANANMESPMMVTFAAVQVFLSSMILGVVIYGDFKLGSSPFLMLKESMPNLPVWKTQPNFIPKDGNGLNPLLQNYWMVIHPPTLFLGFATTLIPFSFAIAALWKRNYQDWIKMAMPWTLASAVILGTGIMMGAIWAYETLNFGGYWSWDPVENAVYVPWLILVTCFHTMLIAQKSSSALKTSFILTITQFILILYSTFLTRSGILGNASVHSFTDLGLSGQLLIYLLFFLFGAIAILAFRWKELPRDEKEISTYSSEFWIFLGITTLCLAAFQVILTTSIPVYNSLAGVFGAKLNMAMPTEPLKHYTVFQMWLFMAVVCLTAVAQYFWWKKTGKGKLQSLINPLIITLLISSVVIALTGSAYWTNMTLSTEIQHILLITVCIFSIVANFNILKDIFKGNFKVAGGATAHIGIAFMLLGILYSSAYERVISLNLSNEKIFKDGKENKENVLLYLNKEEDMRGFKLKFGGEFVDVRKIPGYIEKKFVQPIVESEFKAIAKTDILDGDKKLASKGDTIAYEAENTYYQINYTDKKGNDFNFYPRFQVNQKMGNVASPDIKKFWNRDVYAHVNYITTNEDKEWSVPENFAVAIGDTFFLNDYVAILDKVEPQSELEGMPLKQGDIAAKATVRVLNRDGEKLMYPIFAIKDSEVWSKPVTSNELGIRAQLAMIDPASGKFTFAISRGDKEYVVLKALEKPHINLLWLGTALVMIGISLAAARRFKIDLK
jgi:cytochrome c-type biogenesis protein CcmF